MEGIRHTRHARQIERNLQGIDKNMEASVSASGMVRVEFDTTKIDEAEIFKALRRRPEHS